MTLAALLAAIASTIEAISIDATVDNDARFRCFVAPTPTQASEIMFPRATTIESAGSVPVEPGLLCDEWSAEVEIGTFYPLGQAGAGVQSQLVIAATESDLIATTLRSWARTEDDVNDVQMAAPDLFTIEGEGHVASRTYTVSYRRT